MSVLNWMRMADMPVESVLLKLLLYGDSGAGKSWAAGTAPDPIYLLTEPNGLPTIKASNPRAVVVQADDTHGGMNTVRAFLRAAKDGELARETGCKTVVLDSLNELQRMLRDEIMATKKGTPQEGQFSLQDWGVLTDKMRTLVRAFRDLPFHVVAITHASSETDEATQSRYVGPMFQGKALPNEIAGYFSAVGFMYRERKTNEDKTVTVERRVLLQGPPTVLCKGLPGLDAVETPNLTSWLAKMAAFTLPTPGEPVQAQVEAADPTARKPTGRRSRGTTDDKGADKGATDKT